LCDQEPEPIDHIAASFSFSRQVWWNILAVLGVDASQIGGESILLRWNSWRMRWNGDKRWGVDTFFALVAWELYKERNTRCFHNNASTVLQVPVVIKHVAKQWVDAGACKLG
jgi:hypothetical protein